MNKFEVGQVWLTRNNCKARILDVSMQGRYPIVAIVTLKEGNETVCTHTADGLHKETDKSGWDLVTLAPKEITIRRWINIIQWDGDDDVSAHVFFEEPHALDNNYGTSAKVLARAIPFKWTGPA
jgi:hypothetical protein